MNGHLAAVLADDRNNLEQVPAEIGPKVERLTLVILRRHKRTVNRMFDVLVGDPVSPR